MLMAIRMAIMGKKAKDEGGGDEVGGDWRVVGQESISEGCRASCSFPPAHTQHKHKPQVGEPDA